MKLYKEMTEDEIITILNEKYCSAQQFEYYLKEMLKDIFMSYRHSEDPKDLILLTMIENRIDFMFSNFNHCQHNILNSYGKNIDFGGYTIQWKRPEEFDLYFGGER